MAGTKTENTAVNRLIEMAHERPLEADDALFSSPPPGPRKALPKPFPGRLTAAAPADLPAPLPRTRAPQSTQTQLTAAPPAPIAAPEHNVPTRPFDRLDDDLLDEDLEDDELPITVDDAEEPRVIAARPSAMGAIPGLEEASWYEESVAVHRVDAPEVPARRQPSDGRARTMLWLSAAFAAGLVATAIVAWPGRAAMTPAAPPTTPAVAAAAPVTVVQPAAAGRLAEVAPPGAAAPATVTPATAEPAVVPPLEPAPAVEPPAIDQPVVVEPTVPAEVNVVLESTPAGAVVMLVDDSGARAIGTTPMAYAVDPAQPIEVMFKLEGHRSSLVTVDPAASKRVTVDLASSTVTQEAAAKVAAVEPIRPAKAVKTEPARARKPEPKAVPRVARAEPVRAAPAKPTGGGVLMLGAKPPCDIFIDGKSTGLKTPQRALKVSPGPHKVTLVNRDHKITETFTIDVKAGTPTKVVKDLTKRMK